MSEEPKREQMSIVKFNTDELSHVTPIFSLSLDIPKDLILPFRSYLSLFPRYCLIIKQFTVDFKITEADQNLKLEFGYNVRGNLNIKEIEEHFADFLKLLKEKNIYVCLKKRIKDISDNTLFHKFCMRVEEEIRHLNRVIYLEIGLKRILEIPERSSINIQIDDELQEVKDNSKRQLEEYKQLVKYIGTEKENEYLIEENERLKSEIKKVDGERKKLLNEVLRIASSKFQKAEEAINNNIDTLNIKKLIIQNKIDEVFDLLILMTDTEIVNEVVLLARRWSENKYRYTHQLLDGGSYITENQKIVSGILHLLKKIDC